MVWERQFIEEDWIKEKLINESRRWLCNSPGYTGSVKKIYEKRLNVKKDNMRQNMSKAKAISAKLLELNLKIPLYSPVFLL